MMVKNIFFVCSLFAHFLLFSQETQSNSYTLNDCIEIALENNLDLKRIELKANTSKINFNQSWNDLLPSLNGNYNIGISNGRSIDPFTNAYINRELTFSNAGLNLNTTVFNGFKLANTIKQNNLNLKASQMEIEEAKQNLILNITLAYLQILNANDLLKLAKSRLEVTQKQVERLKVLFDEEVGNPADYTDMKGQLASEHITLINTENNLKEAKLNLFQLLGMEGRDDVSFEPMDGAQFMESNTYNADAVYNEALQNLATFKAKEFRFQSAKVGVSTARAEYVPTISVFGQLNTNYSSAAQLFNEVGTNVVQTGDFVTINNQDYPILANQSQFESNGISYDDQFNNNLNSVIGLSVNIPLFNGFRAKNGVALKKIQLEESSVDLQNTKLLFQQAIQQAYNSMEAAFEKYTVLENQVEAFEESFRINEIRFNNGVSNIVEYITSKNNFDSAALNLSNAKYEYLLRVKILEYYRGV